MGHEVKLVDGSDAMDIAKFILEFQKVVNFWKRHSSIEHKITVFLRHLLGIINEPNIFSLLKHLIWLNLTFYMNSTTNIVIATAHNHDFDRIESKYLIEFHAKMVVLYENHL